MKIPSIIKNIAKAKKERKRNDHGVLSNQDTVSEVDTIASKNITSCNERKTNISFENDNNESNDDISSCSKVSTECDKPLVALVAHNDIKVRRTTPSLSQMLTLVIH